MVASSSVESIPKACATTDQRFCLPSVSGRLNVQQRCGIRNLRRNSANASMFSSYVVGISRPSISAMLARLSGERTSTWNIRIRGRTRFHNSSIVPRAGLWFRSMAMRVPSNSANVSAPPQAERGPSPRRGVIPLITSQRAPVRVPLQSNSEGSR